MKAVNLLGLISLTVLIGACGGSGGPTGSSVSSASSSSSSNNSSSSSSSSSSLPAVDNISHLIPETPTPTAHDVIPAGDRVWFIHPDGNNTDAGSEAQPFATLDHAVSLAAPGDVIVMRGGVYYHSDTIRINNTSGTAAKPITVFAYPGETPILDFTPQTVANNQHGIRLNASYWHLYGLTIRYAGHNGIRMDGSHNRLERLTAHENYDTGIHMAGGASHNLVMNCDSYRNFNSGIYSTRIGNNADGFGAKFNDLGPGNHYYGNRSWENSDDGFDLWRALHPIVLQNNWAFGNGNADVFGNPSGFDGGGNGFKLGGNNDPGDHIVIGNIAFDNFGVSQNAKGFDHNNNTGILLLAHNTAFNNGRNFDFPNAPADAAGRHRFYNNLSVDGAVRLPQLRTDAEGNSWQVASPTASEFMSTNTALATTSRQPDGSLPEIDLLRLNAASALNNLGVNIGLDYEGTAPEIGAFGHAP